MSLKKIFILVIFILPCINTPLIEAHIYIDANVDIDEIKSKIQQAEVALINAYRAVLEAEKSGVDVSSLISSLKLTGEKLTLLYQYEKIDEYDKVENLAEYCIELSEIIKSIAIELKDNSHRRYNQRLMFLTFEWFIVSGTILVVTYFGWQRFKSKYYEKYGGLKPEVINDEY